MASRAPMARQHDQQRRSPSSVASPPDDINEGGGMAASDVKRMTPPPPQTKSKKSNSNNNNVNVIASSSRTRPEMVVDARVLDELLLVCSVIGSTTLITDPITGGTREEFVPVTDCLNWLQDLQRALRRDHETYRPVSLKLGQWKVVCQKLLPLVMSCRYDSGLVMTVCKILVILTKPLGEAAINAGRLTIDIKNKKNSESVIQEQMLLRENAIEQSDLLMEYKHLFVKHPSHHYAFRNNANQRQGTGGKKENSMSSNDSSNGGGGNGLLSIFTSLLAEPLSKTGSSRTSADHLIIELVLHLIRNLLCISPLNTFGSTEKSQFANQLHRELLVVLQEEMVLDVLVCVGQEVERRENSGYNLLLMEILSCLLKGSDPSDVARWDDGMNSTGAAPSFSAPVSIVDKKRASTRTVRTTTTSRSTGIASGGGQDSLKSRLTAERQRLQLATSARHSHFGGTLLISKPGGKQTYVSACDYLANKSSVASSSGTGGGAKGNALSSTSSSAIVRRKNRKAEVFVGSGRSSAIHSSSTISSRNTGDLSAHRALNSFCTKFVKDCYGPVMKSLKNEFRKESSRLEGGDRTMFFRIVWFFHQWWRVGREKEQQTKNIASTSDEDKPENGDDVESGSGDSSTRNLIFTMDVFMFNLVLNSTDEFFEHKKYAALAQTAALYTEMIHTLHIMYNSTDSTERMMALGLMDRLFYATEPLDRLPRLLSRWIPGMYGREYLCDLVECLHVTWKLLDTNAERCMQSVISNEDRNQRPTHAVERMNLTASEFDKDHYFIRKFVSNQITFMYTQLLSRYNVNAANVNRHIVAYFIRLSKFSVKNMNGEDDDAIFDDAMGTNELIAKQSTLEPMLYNIGLFTVLDRILNDPAIRDKDDYASLLMFASSFMQRFARAVEINPILYVEALFKHPIPHRFCEQTTNLYVNEEIRMIAVRDLLLEDQRKYEQAEEVVAIKNGDGKAGLDEEDVEPNNKASGFNDESEDEIEFNDDNMDTDVAFAKKRRRKSRMSRKSRIQWDTSSVTDAKDGEEKEGNEKTDEDDAIHDEDIQENDEQRHEDKSFGTTMVDDVSEVLPNDDSIEEGTILSGNKRIRKSLEAATNEDSSDDEDFTGSVDPAKLLTKRFIFDDEDD